MEPASQRGQGMLKVCHVVFAAAWLLAAVTLLLTLFLVRAGDGGQLLGVHQTTTLVDDFVLNHLVIGGGFFCDTGPSPSYEVNGQSVELDNVTQYIIGLGGFVDYYVWSDRGLHFPLFLGWGGLETSADGNAGGSDPTGFITYFGGGYEFWMSDEWSIGALFRLVIAPSKLNDVSYTTIEPGFLLTLTYH